jgi:spore coat polysaccharide biosynthesis protein SpsF (cytidylyltransferase family)
MYKNDGTIVSGPDGVIVKMESIKKAQLLAKALTRAFEYGKIKGKSESQVYGETYLDSVAFQCGLNVNVLVDALNDFDVTLSK